MKLRNPCFFILLAPMFFSVAGAVFAQSGSPRAATDLLLPYFEVSRDRGLSTVFEVVNQTAEPVSIRISVRSGWGIELTDLTILRTLAPAEVLPADLASWLVDGRLPGKTLSPEMLGHVQAALSGEASPRTRRYYSAPAGDDSELLTGSVVIEVAGSRVSPRPPALWGNYFIVSPRHGSAQIETLVDTTPSDQGGADLCSRHAVRFYDGGGFDAGTELLVWSSTVGTSGTDPRYFGSTVDARLRAYDESGDERARIRMSLEPLERIRVRDLGLPNDFGWLEIETDAGTAVVARYSADDLYSGALEPYCLRSSVAPRIDLEKRVNGVAAHRAPGPWVDSGQPLTWTYHVTNRSDVALHSVEVTDTNFSLVIRCPDDTLLAGQSMTCSASDVATGCSYLSVGHVSAVTSDGLEARDFDEGHYRVRQDVEIELEIDLGGGSDLPPGALFQCGESMTAAFVVRNTGESALSAVTVTADEPATTVTCPSQYLAAGESMICTARVAVTEGEHSLTGRVTASPLCGVAQSAADTAFYHGVCSFAEIRLESFVNGVDADDPPGPSVVVGNPLEWSFVVSNPGTVDLGDVAATHGVDGIECPADVLQAGETMVCTGHGVASPGPRHSLARVTAISGEGEAVSDMDSTHYQGQPTGY